MRSRGVGKRDESVGLGHPRNRVVVQVGFRTREGRMNVENIGDECEDESEEHIEAEQEQPDILSEVFFERVTFFKVCSNQQFRDW